MKIELVRLATETEKIEALERALTGMGKRSFPEQFEAKGKAVPNVFPEQFEAKGKAVPTAFPE